jgi:CRISPR-associated protein Cas1
VHSGTQHAFVYDIADLYKARLTLPVAFSLHQDTNPEAAARRKLREDLRLVRLLPNIVSDVQQLLAPGTRNGPPLDEDEDEADESEQREVRMVHLWDPDRGALPAGTNYANEAD